MATELPKAYAPQTYQQQITKRWLETGAFAAIPDQRPRTQRYVIMMQLPNVTGALHMGHAMDNVMQDLLIRWHRMQGDNTLWQPGTDHAGIATQAVVEKRLFELEGKTRHDVGRDALVQRIWAWKDEYQQRIIHQQQQMGCSCDWDRYRFTMDPVCSAAVRESFFRLFADRLIYRGDRLVNWDCQLQTAVADDEVYHETVQGHFWHLRYPVIDPQPGEPAHVVVATTRPETMLGDTAVACHPNPRAALQERIAEQEQKLASAPAREKAATAAELERLREREQTHLAALEQLVAMAQAGRKILLPLLQREIPLIMDEWAKPELGTGCVKITPGHDPNDYDVWLRHQGKADGIGIINILEPDGCLNHNAGPYSKLDRLAARERVVQDLIAQDLMEEIEDREVEIGHSDRSKTPIEPYLSKQWFVRMGDIDGGIGCGRGTKNEFRAPGLAQAAIDAVSDRWKTPTGRQLAFHPPRYRAGYVAWLAEKRDWCISRQLWWGHRIPVWSRTCKDADELAAVCARLPQDISGLRAWAADAQGTQHDPQAAIEQARAGAPWPFEVQVCLRTAEAEAEHEPRLADLGLAQDPDVLDTWFSSAQWPFSTLGWPDPSNAPIGAGQTHLGDAGTEDAFSYYYPGSCLVTARDIITLWVARMVMLGLFNHGDVPFTDCFVHAKILDGKGVTMSKSKGNGIDPVDIIERYGADAMRYLICAMETGMQDVRLPVQATCPSCQTVVELTDAEHGQTIFTYLCTGCGAEFDVLGTMQGVPASKVSSDRFEVGKNFCNKLWNAARFALMNLGTLEYQPRAWDSLAPEDRWILSRLARTARTVTAHLAAYSPSAALTAARDFFWGEFCDWYLELIKPRVRDAAQAPVARQVLAVALDQQLRLLHPFVPFITEALWSFLGQQAPQRGIDRELVVTELCVTAPWPALPEAWEDDALDAEFVQLQQVISRLRELRSRPNVPPNKRLPAAIKASGEALVALRRHQQLIVLLSNLESLELGEEVMRPKHSATQMVGELELFLGDVLDPEQERARLEAQRAKLSQQLAASEKRLQNPGFVQKAPPQVVEKERVRVQELRSQLELIDKNLSELG